MKRRLSLILAALLLASAASGCGSEPTQSDDTTNGSDNSESTTGKADEYNYPKLDLGGQDFVFITRDGVANMYNTIEVDEQNGDLLDDAVYKRNIAVEDMYNLNIVNVKTTEINEDIQLAVNSGDNVYQAAYPLTNTLGSMVLEGMFWDLNKGSGFNFDREWWDQAVMDDVKIGDEKAVYFANSDLSLLNFEATWCLYFNRRMVEDLQLDLPYQTVRDGKWTFDELYKYISAGANLNGDENFYWNKDGKCVYGFTSMVPDFITQCYVSSDEKQIKFEDGTPKLMVGSDRFYQVTETFKKIFGETGTAFFSNDSSNGSHYELVFGAGRSMFTAGEIKGGNGGGVYSEMKDDYGIVPMPKFDENQKSYISPIAVWTYFLTVPVSNPDIETASIVLDTMSYLSYRDIVPIYYDVVLQVKHIRDEETSEMLDIIRSTRTYYTAYAFGFGADIRNNLAGYIAYDGNEPASIIATYKDATIAEMDKAMETFNSK